MSYDAPASRAVFGAGFDNPDAFTAALGPDLGHDYEFDTVNPAGNDLPAGWSWVNQGTANYRENFGSGRIDKSSGDPQPNWRGIVKPLPVASSFVVYLKTFCQWEAQGSYYGPILRDSSLGGFVTPELYRHTSDGTETHYVGAWSTPTVSGTPQIYGTPLRLYPAGAQKLYTKITKVSPTNWTVEVNNDGGCWFGAAVGFNPTTQANIAAVDQIGYGASSSGGWHVGCEFVRIRNIVV